MNLQDVSLKIISKNPIHTQLKHIQPNVAW
jgi:hypothetical protein